MKAFRPQHLTEPTRLSLPDPLIDLTGKEYYVLEPHKTREVAFYSGEGRFIHSISPEEEQKEEAVGEFFALEPLTKDLHL